MDSIISMVTLYDIISMTIPGAIVLSALLFIVNDLVEVDLVSQNLFFNHSAIVFFVFIILSYSLGWINSQFAKFFEKGLITKLILCTFENIKKMILRVFGKYNKNNAIQKKNLRDQISQVK